MGQASRIAPGRGYAEPSADLGREAVEEISSELRRLLADAFALYLKTTGTRLLIVVSSRLEIIQHRR